VRRLLGLMCVALISLPACGRAPTPIEPTTKASTSSSGLSAEATSTLTPPALPAAAKRNDETGAANFVAYWVRLANYASQTGDTSLLRRASASNCGACSDYIQLYEKTYDAGGYIRGGLDKLADVEVERGSTEHFVRARVTSSAGTFKASKASPLRKTPSERLWIIYGAKFESSHWILTQIGIDR
jgi:hypothetical protein